MIENALRSSEIRDGDRVRHVFRPGHGTAFIRNADKQWLVKWDNEEGLEIVHAIDLERVD